MGEFGSEFGGELRKIKKRESEMSFEGSHLLEGLKEPFSDLRQKEKLCLGKETKITTEFDFDGLFDNKDLLEIPKDSELNTDTSPIEDDGPSSDAFSIKTELKESNTIQDVPSDDLKQQINDEITDEIVRLRKLKDSWELAEKEATSDYNTEIQYKNSEISREVKPRMNLMEVWVIAEAEAALGEKLGHEKTQIGSDLMLTKEFAPELPEERKMDDLWRLSEKYLARGYEIVREKLLVNENKNELPQEHERVEHILTTRKHEQNQKEIEHKELDIITEVKAKNLYQAECNVMVRERLNSAIVGSKNSRNVAMKSYALPHTPLQAVEKSFRSHEQELSVDQMTSGLLTDQSKVQPYNTNPIYRNSNEIPDYRDIKGITENIEIAQKIKQISKKANDSRFKLYILYHEDNPDLLYVGRTENVILKKRFEEHYSFAFRDSSNRKISKNIKERSKNGWHIEHLAVYILKNEPEIYLECEGRGLLFPKTYLNMVDLETFWINYFNSYTKGMNSKEGEGILIPLNTDLIYKKQFEILKSESMLIQKILHKYKNKGVGRKLIGFYLNQNLSPDLGELKPFTPKFNIELYEDLLLKGFSRYQIGKNELLGINYTELNKMIEKVNMSKDIVDIEINNEISHHADRYSVLYRILAIQSLTEENVDLTMHDIAAIMNSRSVDVSAQLELMNIPLKLRDFVFNDSKINYRTVYFYKKAIEHIKAEGKSLAEEYHKKTIWSINKTYLKREKFRPMHDLSKISDKDVLSIHQRNRIYALAPYIVVEKNFRINPLIKAAEIIHILFSKDLDYIKSELESLSIPNRVRSMLDLHPIDRSNIDLLLRNLRTRDSSAPPFYKDYYYGKISKLGKKKPKNKIIRKDYRAQ